MAKKYSMPDKLKDAKQIAVTAQYHLKQIKLICDKGNSVKAIMPGDSGGHFLNIGCLLSGKTIGKIYDYSKANNFNFKLITRNTTDIFLLIDVR